MYPIGSTTNTSQLIELYEYSCSDCGCVIYISRRTFDILNEDNEQLRKFCPQCGIESQLDFESSHIIKPMSIGAQSSFNKCVRDARNEEPESYTATIHIEFPNSGVTRSTKEEVLSEFNINRQISDNIYEDMSGNLILIEGD